MATPRRSGRIRIGLLGMYASANLGDTAIQCVVMSVLKSLRPEVEFVGLSHDPVDVVRTHGIAAFPASGEGSLVSPAGHRASSPQAKAATGSGVRGWAVLRRLVALRNIDRQVRELHMLLVSGGGQIDDFWGGAWHQPFRLFAWCFLAWLHGKPVAAFSIGVDDLRTPLSAWLSTRALRLARYLTFRDSGSLQILRSKGLAATAAVCPDPAFGLVSGVSAASRGRTERPFVVISPISSQAFSVSSDAYEAYLAVLVAAAAALEARGLEVRFVCSQTRMDPPVAKHIASRMNGRPEARIADIGNVDDFVGAVRGAQLVIASRLHAVVLSLVAGTMVVAIAPARKVRQQMADVGLERYCLDMQGLEASALLAVVDAALAGREDIRRSLELRVGELRRNLRASFEQLAAVIPPAGLGG